MAARSLSFLMPGSPAATRMSEHILVWAFMGLPAALAPLKVDVTPSVPSHCLGLKPLAWKSWVWLPTSDAKYLGRKLWDSAWFKKLATSMNPTDRNMRVTPACFMASTAWAIWVAALAGL